jgi:hypothetical protein
VTGTGRRVELAVVALCALLAVVFWAVAPTYPNYDAYYHLVWGRDLFDGLKPNFEAYAAPTQHPLEIVAGGVLGLIFGVDADRAVVLIAVLSLVLTGWAVFRLGLRVLGLWPALAGTFFAASSFSLLLLAARGYRDVPFLALVFWAAVRAVEGRSDRSVMGLLTVAGLLRPEAWLLAGLYALWRRSWKLVLAAGIAPVIWVLTDLWVTGDPLWSLTGTSDLAADLGRERGVAKVPGAFVSFVFDALRAPVAVAAVAGLGVALWRLGWRRLLVPLALLAAGVLTFVGTGIAGLSILPRYLTVPTVTLCLFAGYAFAGFVDLPRSQLRRLWTVGACVLLVGGMVFAVVRMNVVTKLTAELAFLDASHRDFVALLDRPEVRRGMECGPLTFPNYRLVPDARWYLDAGRSSVLARSARRPARGVAVFVVGDKPLRRFGFADGASPSTNAPDPGFVRTVRVGRFVAYTSC